MATRQQLDALEWAAVDRENGFIHLRAFEYKGHANGLGPVWDGVTIHAARQYWRRWHAST